MTIGRVDAPLMFGRFEAMLRRDGVWIVYDPARPFGHRTAWTGEPRATRDDASAACRQLSKDATSRGEPNEHERHGFRLDWSNPKTWEDNA